MSEKAMFKIIIYLYVCTHGSCRNNDLRLLEGQRKIGNISHHVNLRTAVRSLFVLNNHLERDQRGIYDLLLVDVRQVANHGSTASDLCLFIPHIHSRILLTAGE